MLYHEAGHVVAGECKGPGHYRDPRVKDWWHCLRCETNAWIKGRRLAEPLGFTEAMMRRMAEGLKGYRKSTERGSCCLTRTGPTARHAAV